MSSNKWKQMKIIRERHKELARRIFIDKEDIELPDDFRERKNYVDFKLLHRFEGRKLYRIMGGPEPFGALMTLVMELAEARKENDENS